MNWILRRSAAAKILLAFAALVILMVTVAFTAVRAIQSIRTSLHQMHSVEFSNAVDLAVIRGRQNEIRGHLWKMLAVNDLSAIEEDRLQNVEYANDIDNRLHALIARNQDDPDFLELIKSYQTAWNAYYLDQAQRQIPLLEGGNNEAALQLALGTQKGRIDSLRKLAESLVSSAEQRANSGANGADDKARSNLIVLCVVSLLSIAVGFGLGLFLSVLVRRVTREIDEGVSVLAASTTEILASSTQVASGATETATAITQTTSTVEEVRQTATVASTKARSVSDAAQRASTMARSGAQSVNDVRKGIQAIQDQMQAISESVLRLSENGQNIGSIIASVDDLAEQSNLLAVNAAIEAAKAGDQGRGFAVVAQEVRNLAEQSKEATRQVRQVLNEIQKGVSAAGMATEQGAKAAANGMQQAAAAVQTIEQVLVTVEESAQAAIQISAASQQQLAGMDQVNDAMGSIRDASEQNVSATHQVEDSARMLTDLGKNLQTLVVRYLQPVDGVAR